MDTRPSRIDYVRLRLPSDGLDKAEAVVNWEDTIRRICDKHHLDPKCFSVDMYYDYHLKRKIPYYNVWGPAADHFFNTLETADIRRLMRVDYRETIQERIEDFDQLFFVLKKRNRGKLSTKLLTSSARSKSGGRDTGGDMIAIGAEGSQRRIAIYERGREGPVWEFQLAGASLKAVVSQTMHDANLEVVSAIEHLRMAVQAEADRYFVKYTGIEVGKMADADAQMNGMQDYTDPENIASQLDLFWDIAPAEVREAFLEAHTTAEPHAIARAVDAELFVNEADWQETDVDTLPEGYPEYDWSGDPDKMIDGA